MTLSHRLKCFNEKPKECTVCGWDNRVIVHHADGDKTNDELANLVPLCPSCHRRVHQCNPTDPELRALKQRVDGGINESTVGKSLDPGDYDGVPVHAYITVKETKPGYKYYYWQWRDSGQFKNEYIAPCHAGMVEKDAEDESQRTLAEFAAG